MYRPKTEPSGKTAFIFLALLWAAPVQAGAPKQVAVPWEELAPLVEKREIETVLANGVHIRGRVEWVVPEALVVRVKRTSDPNLVPKGYTRVARELVSELTVRWKRGPARAVLAIAGWFGLPILIGISGAEEIGTRGAFAIAIAGAATGYVVGSHLDARTLRVQVYGQRHPAQQDRHTNQ